MTSLDAIAEAAARWTADEYDRRTRLIEAGQDVNPYWIVEDSRVSWTEIVDRFPELTQGPGGPVDGRIALDEAQERLGLKPGRGCK